MFRTFGTPSGSGQVRRAGIIDTEITVWQDVRWKDIKSFLSWSTMLVWSEGGSFAIPMPQNAHLGDHIVGMSDDRAGLRSQWRYWLDHEMAWLDRDAVPVYHTTSNHNTYSAESEQVWREFFPDLPRNGPTGQEGLSYWLRSEEHTSELQSLA